MLVNGALTACFYRSYSINGIPYDIKQTPANFFADRHGNRLAGINYFCAANEAFRSIHGNGAYQVFTEVLLHLEDKSITVVALNFKSIQNLGQCGTLTGEAYVHHGANHLRNSSFIHELMSYKLLGY